jgi:8-amino-7-oxononanoate synthase
MDRTSDINTQPLFALKSEVQAQLNELEANSLRRELAISHPDLNVLVDFSTSDYLGFRHDAFLKSELLKTLREHWDLQNASDESHFPQHPALGSGASRLVYSDDQKVLRIEDLCRSALGFDDAVYLSSGFSANLCFFDSLKAIDGSKGNTEIFLESSSHSSLFMGARASGVPLFTFQFARLQHLKNSLLRSAAHHKIICFETLHSMDGTLAPLHALVAIAKETNSLVFVDEAHSFGVFGARGAGMVSDLSAFEKQSVLAVMLGFGKACGAVGGVLVTHSWLKSLIVNKSRPLIYSTGPSPLSTMAASVCLEAVLGDLGEQRRENLQRNVLHFHSFWPQANLGPIQTLWVDSASNALIAEARLLEAGFLVKAIRPPTVPKDKCRLRIILHSHHTFDQIGKLCKVLISLEQEKLLRF